MKRKYMIAAMMIGGIMVFTSCDKELDMQQKGVVQTEQYYSSDKDMDHAVANLYYQLHEIATSYLLVKNSLSDDCYVGGRGMAINEINDYLFTSDNSELKNLFQGYYNIIYSANIIINMTEPNSQAKMRAIAEAKVLRAWSYFDLVTLWGPVPLITEAMRSDYHASNSDPSEVWAQIEEDLKDAASSNALPSKSDVNDKDTPVRITKETALAILGKVYVFEGKYADANTQFDAVINSGLYELMPLESDGYIGYASARNDNNSEVLLQINRLNDAAVNTMELTCMYVGIPTSRGFEGAMNPKSPFYSECWGFTSSTKEGLVKAFKDNVARNGVEDIRYLTTIYDAARLQSDFGLTVKPGTMFEENCGYFTTKYASLNENHIPMTWAGFYQNTTLMRYAEVLLLAAESHLQTGDAATALKYVNQIRRHAGEPEDNQVTLADIKTEKRLELCNECVRYQDLLRWGDAYDTLKDQGKQVAFYGFLGGNVLEVAYPVQQPEAGFKKNKNELLPFPYSELNVNPNIVQNPGY